MNFSVANSDIKIRRDMIIMASSYQMLQPSSGNIAFELETGRASYEATSFIVIKSRFNLLDIYLYVSNLFTSRLADFHILIGDVYISDIEVNYLK